MKFEWEEIYYSNASDKTAQFCTARAKVEGGWIVSHSLELNKQASTCMTFLSDPEHKWTILDDNS